MDLPFAIVSAIAERCFVNDDLLMYPCTTVSDLCPVTFLISVRVAPRSAKIVAAVRRAKWPVYALGFFFPSFSAKCTPTLANMLWPMGWHGRIIPSWMMSFRQRR